MKKKSKSSLWIRRVGRILCVFAALLLVLILTSILVIGSIRGIHRIQDAAKTKQGISEEVLFNLGDQKQYGLIYGEKTDNPVIIWIHGGPGSPDTMMTYYLARELGKDYTVVAFNERGSGRTYYLNRDADPENQTATFDQLEADLDLVVDQVCERFGQKQVILAGHSFGTMVGSRYALEHPEKVQAYIGIGQMGRLGSDLYAFEDAIFKAQAAGDDTTQMQAAYDAYVAEPNIPNMLTMRNYTDPYHVATYHKNYILSAFLSPYFGLDDLKWYLSQTNLSAFLQLNQQLFDYIQEEDVYAFGLDYQVPVGILTGSDDWVTPVRVAREYYDAISAPVKTFYEIDGWGHSVPQENPKATAEAMHHVLKEIGIE